MNLEFGEIAALIQFFSGRKTEKLFFEYDDVIVTSQLAVQVWEGYFVIFREHPLRNNSQQSDIPRKKKPKDLE